jgi:hypothetical protein
LAIWKAIFNLGNEEGDSESWQKGRRFLTLAMRKAIFNLANEEGDF